MATIFKDKIELVKAVKDLMGSSYDVVSVMGFERAIDNALGELRWSLPCTDSEQAYWMTERARRHVIYILLVESAHKFRFKEIHLHNRFAQYHKLIQMMDKEFAEKVKNNPSLFDIGTYDQFSFYLTSGFVYDYTGDDLTYLDWSE